MTKTDLKQNARVPMKTQPADEMTQPNRATLPKAAVGTTFLPAASDALFNEDPKEKTMTAIHAAAAATHPARNIVWDRG